jgi:hypothetical protein
VSRWDEMLLTPERLREVLSYDDETGVFTRKLAVKGNATSDAVGTIGHKGYVVIGIDRRKYYGHRLAWFYIHGEWPEECIDHKNGVKSDNRLANLRSATPRINNQNHRRPSRRNTSGYLGVYRRKDGKWVAQIKVDGKAIWIGSFDYPEKAAAAYIERKREVHIGGTL